MGRNNARTATERQRRFRRRIRLGVDEAPIYGRGCPECGFVEYSLDVEFYRQWRECPACAA